MGLPGFGQLHQRADALTSPVPRGRGGGRRPDGPGGAPGGDRPGMGRADRRGGRGRGPPAGGGVGIGLDGFAILDVEGGEAQAVAAVAEVREGRARLLAKGMIATPSLMHAVLDPEHGLRSGRVVCQVVLMEVVPARPAVPDGRHRDLRQAEAGDQGRHRPPGRRGRPGPGRGPAPGGDDGRLRVGQRGMPETRRRRRTPAAERGPASSPAASIQGPLSFDLAYSADAGGKKRVEGEVVGRADAMVFPDLLSANLTVKAIMYTADCRFGGVLRGTTAPVAFMSRADTAATRLNSLALALGAGPGPRHPIGPEPFLRKRIETMSMEIRDPFVAGLRHELAALRGNWLWFVILGIVAGGPGRRRPGFGGGRVAGHGRGDRGAHPPGRAGRDDRRLSGAGAGAGSSSTCFPASSRS